MKSNFLGVLLCGAMVCSLLTACGGKGVAKDFLSENGLKITPNGVQTVNLAASENAGVTDVLTEATIRTKVTTNDLGNGYVDEIFTVEFLSDRGEVAYNVSAFDRYTGTSFESKAGENINAVVIDYDGKKYDCKYDWSYDDGDNFIITISAVHPTEYDGVVFLFGPATKSQIDAYSAINFDSVFTVTDYSDVFVDGMTFFTSKDY